jgi:hypothetical protein
LTPLGKIHFEGGAAELLSGTSPTATWLTLGSLITSLITIAYGSIHVTHNDLTHAKGPTVTIGATIN